MSGQLPGWVEAARPLPIAFAQVREDPLLDLEIVRRRHEPTRVMMVASGGCTACALASNDKVAAIHLVDPNPAQIALARLKLRLLEKSATEERLALLGHMPMALDGREACLVEHLIALGLNSHALGPLDVVARAGPDHAGRYEHLFAALRDKLQPAAEDLAALLRLDDPEEQSSRVDPATALGRALEEAFREVMALPNLVALFGAEATRNPLKAFATHFVEQTRTLLAWQPARGNSFLAQMLCGRFTPGYEHMWLRAPQTSQLPRITWTSAFMADALKAQPPLWDVVHLSNILDWLSPDEARATLARARSALRPGGWVVIRQLNSSLDIPACGPGFSWDTEWGKDMVARDRSFFYRAIHLGEKT